MRPVMACGHAASATYTATGRPCCMICAPDELAYTEAPAPDLTGRRSRCSCGSISPSSTELAFFEYTGPDSRQSITSCKHCHYYKVAHRPGHSKYICDSFEPHGAYEYDTHYCGHAGWD